MATVKLIRIGNSVGVVLPKETLARMNVDLGDTLSVIEASDGVRLTPYDEKFEAHMAVAREVMKQHRGLLRELAK